MSPTILDNPKEPGIAKLDFVIRDMSARQDIVTEWKKLDQRIQTPVMSSGDWTDIWLKHYGDMIPHQFATAHINGRLVGVCLLTRGVDQKIGPFRVPTLHVGTAGEPEQDSVCVEYNTIPVEAAHRREFLSQLKRVVTQDRSWTEFRLDGMLPEAAVDVAVKGVAHESRRSPSYYFDLEQSRDGGVEILSKLGKSTRKAIKRCQSRFPDVNLEWADDVELAQDIFDELVQLHQERWQSVGEPGAYASERFLGFHQKLLERFVPQRKMVLCRVKKAGETIGCVQLLLSQNRALFYQGAWSPMEKNVSPGLFVHYQCLLECQQRGFEAYDFLAGDARYKKSLSTDANEMVWLSVSRPSWCYPTVRLGRRLKRWISHINPVAKTWNSSIGKPLSW